MTVFALDTNIISYMMQKDPLVITKYKQEVDKGNECIIPPIVYYEIKRGLLVKNASSKAKSFDRLCQDFGVGEMNLETWDSAAEIYRSLREQGSVIEDADLLIAAFCLANGYILVTNNTKHFSPIRGLQLVNWKS